MTQITAAASRITTLMGYSEYGLSLKIRFDHTEGFNWKMIEINEGLKRYSGRFLGFLSPGQTEKHGAEIRNQPDYPDQDAEFMKVLNGVFILTFQHHTRPGSMDKHQDNSNQSG